MRATKFYEPTGYRAGHFESTMGDEVLDYNDRQFMGQLEKFTKEALKLKRKRQTNLSSRAISLGFRRFKRNRIVIEGLNRLGLSNLRSPDDLKSDRETGTRDKKSALQLLTDTQDAIKKFFARIGVALLRFVSFTAIPIIWDCN